MGYVIIKLLISAAIIVAVSELAKRNAFLGAVLASVPLVTVLAMIWLYVDTRNPLEVADLAQGVLWMILPSLALFLTLPVLLRYHVNFYLALIISLAIMVCCYFLMIVVLKQFSIKI